MLGMPIHEFAPAFATVPLMWTNEATGTSAHLTLVGGIASLHQHADGTLEAKSGWAVGEAKLPRHSAR